MNDYEFIREYNVFYLDNAIKKGIDILEMLYYSIINETRKFNDNKFNYLSKYEQIIKDKFNEYRSSIFNQNSIKI